MVLSGLALLVYGVAFATEIVICIQVTQAAQCIVESLSGGCGSSTHTDTVCCVLFDDPNAEDDWNEQQLKHKKREEFYKQQEEKLDQQEKQPFDFNQPIEKLPEVKEHKKKVHASTKSLLRKAESSNVKEEDKNN